MTEIPPTSPPIDLGIITLTPTELLPTLVPQPPIASPIAVGPTPIPVGPPPTLGIGFGLTPDTRPRFTPTAVVLGGIPGGGGLAGTLSPTDPSLVRSSDVSARGNVATIDGNGRLFVDGQPYYVRVPRAEMRFTHVRWSPDGRWLAFVVQVPNANSDQVPQLQKIDDGLWVVELGSGEPHFVMRQWYDNPHDDPKVRIIEDIMWAPDSNAILVTVRRHRGRASVLVGIGGALTNSQYPNEVDKFPLMDFVGGAWLADGQGFVVTSSLPGEAVRLAIRYRDGRYVQIADGAAFQLWIQNAAQLPDGRFAFLGKPSPTGRLEDSTGRLQLYVLSPGGTPTPVSGEIAGSVVYADWDLARQTVKVRVGGGSSLLTLRVP
jgi:hypothetical protein